MEAVAIRDMISVITERIVEIPWALMQLPQLGNVLDVGSCGATYLHLIHNPPFRNLYCMDPRGCGDDIPPGAVFYRQGILGNTLPRLYFDAVLLLSTIEHIGLPCYGQNPFSHGDLLAMAEIWFLLKPRGRLIMTVPVGRAKVESWYRQYSPRMLRRLLKGWDYTIVYWGFDGQQYVPIKEDEVEKYDYRNSPCVGAGAGAVAGVVARRS